MPLGTSQIDVWVMVSSPQGMILDAKEYFSKIITPFEAEIAWGDREWTGEYRLDHGESMLGYQGEAATAGKAVDLRWVSRASISTPGWA